MLLVQVLQGVMEGVFLFLIASGLTLIFGVSRIVNFAHGSFYMVGAFLTYQVYPLIAVGTTFGFFVTILLCGVLVALLDAPVAVKLAGLAGLALLYWVGGFALFDAGGPLIPLVMPTVGLGAAYGIGGTFTDRRHRQQQRFIRQAFSQYVSPKIAERLSAEPGRLRLGGEKREITVIFTDIAGFTDMSEKLEAEELGAVLNEYLDTMTGIAMARGSPTPKLMPVTGFRRPDRSP